MSPLREADILGSVRWKSFKDPVEMVPEPGVLRENCRSVIHTYWEQKWTNQHVPSSSVVHACITIVHTTCPFRDCLNSRSMTSIPVVSTRRLDVSPSSFFFFVFRSARVFQDPSINEEELAGEPSPSSLLQSVERVIVPIQTPLPAGTPVREQVTGGFTATGNSANATFAVVKATVLQQAFGHPMSYARVLMQVRRHFSSEEFRSMGSPRWVMNRCPCIAARHCSAKKLCSIPTSSDTVRCFPCRWRIASFFSRSSETHP